jgi:hypothetical protein
MFNEIVPFVRIRWEWRLEMNTFRPADKVLILYPFCQCVNMEVLIDIKQQRSFKRTLMTQMFVQVIFDAWFRACTITPLFPNKSRRLAKLHGITHVEGIPQTSETSDHHNNYMSGQFTRHSRRPGPQVLGLHPPRQAVKLVTFDRPGLMTFGILTRRKGH